MSNELFSRKYFGDFLRDRASELPVLGSCGFRDKSSIFRGNRNAQQLAVNPSAQLLTEGL